MKQARIIGGIWCLAIIGLYVIKGSFFSMVAMILTFGIIALSGITLALWKKKYNVWVKVKEQINKNQETEITITLINNSIMPICMALGNLKISNTVTREEIVNPVRLIGGSKAKGEHTFIIKEKYCGCLEIDLVLNRLLDPLMIFARRLDISVSKYCYIMPNVMEYPISKDELDSYDMDSYIYSNEKKGNDPSETFGIREYQVGDSPKTIHWKLTSKMGEVMVRELGLPVENSLLLLLDNRVEPDEDKTGGEEKLSLRDKSVELFFSLSKSLIKQQLSHSIGWYDYRNQSYNQKKIGNIGDLYNLMGRVLNSPFGEDVISIPIHFIENREQSEFANYIIVTANDFVDVTRLENYGAVKVKRAGEYN
ncbi:MAG: DUF58 domain-containing protein [Anaerovoracaceae bacterium]